MFDIQIVIAALAGAAVITFLLIADRRAPPRSGVLVRIGGVIDGESVQLQERYDGFLNVRIHGVRAPIGDEDGADWARDVLAEFVTGKECRLYPIDEDPDGFLVARISVDGFDVGDVMAERGHVERSQSLFRGKFRLYNSD